MIAKVHQQCPSVIEGLAIRDLRVLRGTLPRRAMGLVLEWASEHRDELMEDWNLCSQLKSPNPIAPLT